MKQVQVKLYEYSELSKEAKEKALEEWKNDCFDVVQIMGDEIIDSFKKFVEVTGFILQNYSISYDGYRSCITLEHEYKDEIFEFTGKRALAWLENNVLSALRITHKKRYTNLKRYRNYGDSYKAGSVPTCPFTGYCYDDDFLNTFSSAIKEGYSIDVAFDKVESSLNNALTETYNWIMSEEYYNEHSKMNEYMYLKNGVMSNF